jgi:hypothetical protein
MTEWHNLLYNMLATFQSITSTHIKRMSCNITIDFNKHNIKHFMLKNGTQYTHAPITLICKIMWTLLSTIPYSRYALAITWRRLKKMKKYIRLSKWPEKPLKKLCICCRTVLTSDLQRYEYITTPRQRRHYTIQIMQKVVRHTDFTENFFRKVSIDCFLTPPLSILDSYPVLCAWDTTPRTYMPYILQMESETKKFSSHQPRLCHRS